MSNLSIARQLLHILRPYYSNFSGQQFRKTLRPEEIESLLNQVQELAQKLLLEEVEQLAG